MSGQLPAAEPYTTRFETTVAAVDGREVGLETSYFYAESGGQPADRGSIEGVAVEDVRLVDGDPVHVLAEADAVSPGQQVLCSVDREFRMYCMRAHTASHVLYGAARDLLADLGYGGFDIGEEKVRVDFETTTDVDDDALVALERRANRAVWDSREVAWEQVPVAEARSREAVAFNSKTEEGVFADADAVRVVEVEDWDAAACGGTHVRNTREIGPVTVLDRSNPGEGLTRVEFAVGPTAIERRATEKAAALSASREFGTGVDDLPAAAARAEETAAALRERATDLQGRLAAARLREFGEAAVERDGDEWVVGRVEALGPNDAADPVRDAAGDVGDVVALVGEDGSTFLAVGSAGSTTAEAVVAAVTDEFGGGGGGSESFAQGGGIQVSPETVVSFLRDGDGA